MLLRGLEIPDFCNGKPPFKLLSSLLQILALLMNMSYRFISAISIRWRDGLNDIAGLVVRGLVIFHIRPATIFPCFVCRRRGGLFGTFVVGEVQSAEGLDHVIACA